MNARPAVVEHLQRRRGNELAAADREAQAVAGHRIDEAGGVAGEQQAVELVRADIHGERTQDHRRHEQTGAGEAIAQVRIARELRGQQRGEKGVGEKGPLFPDDPSFDDQAHVDELRFGDQLGPRTGHVDVLVDEVAAGVVPVH